MIFDIVRNLNCVVFVIYKQVVVVINNTKHTQKFVYFFTCCNLYCIIVCYLQIRFNFVIIISQNIAFRFVNYFQRFFNFCVASAIVLQAQANIVNDKVLGVCACCAFSISNKFDIFLQKFGIVCNIYAKVLNSYSAENFKIDISACIFCKVCHFPSRKFVQRIKYCITIDFEFQVFQIQFFKTALIWQNYCFALSQAWCIKFKLAKWYVICKIFKFLWCR